MIGDVIRHPVDVAIGIGAQNDGFHFQILLCLKNTGRFSKWEVKVDEDLLDRNYTTSICHFCIVGMKNKGKEVYGLAFAEAVWIEFQDIIFVN